MKAVDFIEKIVALGGMALPVEKVNTCNPWGFDGWYGNRHSFLLDGIRYELRDGHIGTRHTGPKKIFTVYSYEPEFFRTPAKDFLESVSKSPRR